MHGLNALFGLKILITVGDGLMTAVATGTAIFASALPIPPSLKVMRNLDIIDDEDERLMEVQRRLMSISESNRARIEEELSKLNVGNADLDVDNSSDSENDDVSRIFSTTSKLPSSRPGVIVQIDDEADEDLVLFLDESQRDGFMIFSTQNLPCSVLKPFSSFEMVTIVKQKRIPSGHHPNRQLANVFKSIYQDLSFQLHHWSPCVVSKISKIVRVAKDESVQICFTAMVQGIQLARSDSNSMGSLRSLLAEPPDVDMGNVVPNDVEQNRDDSSESNDQDELVHELEVGEDEKDIEDDKIATSSSEVRRFNSTGHRFSQVSFKQDSIGRSSHSRSKLDGRVPSQMSITGGTLNRAQSFSSLSPIGIVEISPLSFIPLSKLEVFLGRISLHFIKETHLVYESLSGMNGMGGFSALFMQEMLAVVKAHVAGLGGNAIIGYNIDQFIFTESINQGYALVSISGDVVRTVQAEMETPE